MSLELVAGLRTSNISESEVITYNVENLWTQNGMCLKSWWFSGCGAVAYDTIFAHQQASFWFCFLLYMKKKNV